MTIFETYSQFYDLLYAEKNYDAECEFLESVWKRYIDREVRSILDLGCGTGGHALPLAGKGYAVTGVDLSPAMLAIAGEKAQTNGIKVEWQTGDIRTIRLQRTFDAVISMFAVIGYQTENQDVSDAFETARIHLEPGGLVIFDVWFGPAVLTDRPTDRIRIVDQGDTRVIRFSQPEFDLMCHTVSVNYSLLQLREDVILRRVTESHKMRFFFPQELSYFLSQAGFRVLKFCPLLHPDEEMTTSHFNMVVVAQAV